MHKPKEKRKAADDLDVLQRPLTEEEKRGLVKKSRELRLPNPCPFVRVEDMNNKNQQDILDCNPERLAIKIGLHWSF